RPNQPQAAPKTTTAPAHTTAEEPLHAPQPSAAEAQFPHPLAALPQSAPPEHAPSVPQTTPAAEALLQTHYAAAQSPASPPANDRQAQKSCRQPQPGRP